MKIPPRFYTCDYDAKDVIKVSDAYKQKVYIKHGLYPCDVYVDNKNKLVMLFKKSTLT